MPDSGTPTPDSRLPIYEHDCEVCAFMGHLLGYDVYYCEAQGKSLPTIVARYGSDGPEYTSGRYVPLSASEIGSSGLIIGLAIAGPGGGRR